MEEHRALFDLARAATAALRSATGCEGLNLGVNLGAPAGAGIAEHLHVHLVPRWKGDQNFMPVIADVRVMPEALDETYARLAPAFETLREGSAGARPRAEQRASSGRPARKAGR